MLLFLANYLLWFIFSLRFLWNLIFSFLVGEKCGVYNINKWLQGSAIRLIINFIWFIIVTSIWFMLLIENKTNITMLDTLNSLRVTDLPAASWESLENSFVVKCFVELKSLKNSIMYFNYAILCLIEVPGMFKEITIIMYITILYIVKKTLQEHIQMIITQYINNTSLIRVQWYLTFNSLQHFLLFPLIYQSTTCNINSEM